MSDFVAQIRAELNLNEAKQAFNNFKSSVESQKLKIEIDPSSFNEIKKLRDDIFSGKGVKTDFLGKGDFGAMRGQLQQLQTEIRNLGVAMNTAIGSESFKGMTDSIDMVKDGLNNLIRQLGELKGSVGGMNLSLDFGKIFGVGNQFTRNAQYGDDMRRNVLPQLKAQAEAIAKEFETQLGQSFGGDMLNSFAGIVRGTKLNSKIGELMGGGSLAAALDPSAPLRAQADAMREYIGILSQAAKIKGVDLSSVNTQFSKSADELINDAKRIQTGADEAKNATEQLKNIFGGGLDSATFKESIDLILMALQDLYEEITQISSADLNLGSLSEPFNQLNQNLSSLNALLSGYQQIGNTAQQVGQQVGNAAQQAAQQVGNATQQASQQVQNFRKNMDVPISARGIKEVIGELNSMKADGQSLNNVEKALESIRQSGIQIQKVVPKFDTDVGGLSKLDVHGVDALGNAVVVTSQFVQATKQVPEHWKTVTSAVVEFGNAAGTSIGNANKQADSFAKQAEKIKRAYDETKYRTAYENRRGTSNRLVGNTGDALEAKNAFAAYEAEYKRLEDHFQGITILSDRDLIASVDNLKLFEAQYDNAIKRMNDATKANSIDSAAQQLAKRFENAKSSIENGVLSKQQSGLEKQLDQFADKQSQGYKDAAAAVEIYKQAVTDVNALPRDNNGALSDAEATVKAVNNATDAYKAASNAIDTLKNKSVGVFSNSDIEKVAQNITDASGKMDTAGSKFGGTLQNMNAELDKFAGHNSQAMTSAQNAVQQYGNALDTIRNQIDLYQKGDTSFDVTALQNAVSTLQRAGTEYANAIKQVRTEVKDTMSLDNIAGNFKAGDFTAQLTKMKSGVAQYGDQVSNSMNIAKQAIADYESALKTIQEQTQYRDDGNPLFDPVAMQNAAAQAATAMQTYKNAMVGVEQELSKVVSEQDALIASKSVEAYITNNSKAMAKYGDQLRSLAARYKEVRDVTSKAKLDSEFKELKASISAEGLTGRSWLQDIGQAAKHIAAFTGLYATLKNVMIQGPRQMISAVQEINKAQIELRKVTTAPESELDRYWDTAAESARKYGDTISNIIDSTASWSRLGYNLADASTLTDVTAKLARVGSGLDTSKAAEGLQATIRGFSLAADEAERVGDIVNYIADTEPIDAEGIFAGLERSASAMAAANNSLEETIGLITAANSVVQDPAKVGTAFQTISMRIRGRFECLHAGKVRVPCCA